MASMVANGISNSVNAVYPTALSATWFPPEERTLATAIMAMGNFLGNALGFILGPLVVPEGSTDIDDIKQMHGARFSTEVYN
jgi:FLVCR family MFS transporter